MPVNKTAGIQGKRRPGGGVCGRTAGRMIWSIVPKGSLKPGMFERVFSKFVKTKSRPGITAPAIVRTQIVIGSRNNNVKLPNTANTRMANQEKILYPPPGIRDGFSCFSYLRRVEKYPTEYQAGITNRTTPGQKPGSVKSPRARLVNQPEPAGRRWIA